jgi:hypothetical protein
MPGGYDGSFDADDGSTDESDATASSGPSTSADDSLPSWPTASELGKLTEREREQVAAAQTIEANEHCMWQLLGGFDATQASARKAYYRLSVCSPSSISVVRVLIACAEACPPGQGHLGRPRPARR